MTMPAGPGSHYTDDGLSSPAWLGGPRSGPAQPLDIYITTQQLPTTLLRNLPPSGEITGDQGREGLTTNIERAEPEPKCASN